MNWHAGMYRFQCILCYERKGGREVFGETGFKADEIRSAFILDPANMDGLSGKWELSTYSDELGVSHVRLSLAAGSDDEAWEIIKPSEDGVPLETLLSSE